MKDKVVSITPDGDYKGTPKFKVSLENDGMYTFFGNFNAKEGGMIEYEISNPKYKTAKLVRSQGFAPSKPKYDTNQSILRQVAFKGAIELVVASKIDLTEVDHYTNEFHNLLNN